jgi:hypothetical protein
MTVPAARAARHQSARTARTEGSRPAARSPANICAACTCRPASGMPGPAVDHLMIRSVDIIGHHRQARTPSSAGVRCVGFLVMTVLGHICKSLSCGYSFPAMDQASNAAGHSHGGSSPSRTLTLRTCGSAFTVLPLRVLGAQGVPSLAGGIDDTDADGTDRGIPEPGRWR